MALALPSYLRITKDGVILEVFVAPRAKRSQVVGLHDGLPKIALAAPPLDGRANEELLDFLKELLRIPGRSLELIRGDASRRKAVLIRGVPPEKVLQLLELAGAS